MALQDRHCELYAAEERRWKAVYCKLAALMLSLMAASFAQPLIADSRVTATSQVSITKTAPPSAILPAGDVLLSNLQALDETTCIDTSQLRIPHQLQLTFDTRNPTINHTTNLNLQGNRGDFHTIEVRLHSTDPEQSCSSGEMAVLQFDGKHGGSELSRSQQYTGTQHLVIVAL